MQKSNTSRRVHTVLKPYSRPAQASRRTEKRGGTDRSSLQALHQQYVNAPAGQNDCHLLWKQCKQLQPANRQCLQWVKSCQTLREKSLQQRHNGKASKVPNEDTIIKCWEHWKRESKTCPISLEETEDIACFPCGHMISVESYKKLPKTKGRYACPSCRKNAENDKIRTLHIPDRRRYQ